jgi:hypothetical protein
MTHIRKPNDHCRIDDCILMPAKKVFEFSLLSPSEVHIAVLPDVIHPGHRGLACCIQSGTPALCSSTCLSIKI